MDDHDVRWRSLGALFVAGGVLALVSLLLPAEPGTRATAVLLVGIAACATGTMLAVAARHLPRGDGWLSGVLAFGTVLITLAVIFNRSTASPYALIYVWVGFDGFYFLRRGHAYLHLAWVGIAYALALLLIPAGEEVRAVRWFLLVGTLGVIGTLADLLRSRSDALIGRLGEAARTDPLTGLLNRRGFDEALDVELERAARLGSPASLLIVDLDHFKRINDHLGHRSGDAVLRSFAVALTASKRKFDIAGRIGGEEFALLLPGTDATGAFLVAERFRRSVREQLVGVDGPLTASIGVGAFPADGRDAETLLHHADEAMYAAKHLGRDRVVAYNPEIAAVPSEGGGTAPVEHLSAVLLLAETLDLRDTGTAAHSQTVGHYAELLAAELGLPPARIERIRLAGVLHDVGKIGVPDAILSKPGRLDDREWAEMRKHPEMGARIVAGSGLEDISDWVVAHHERPDGTGYPFGLRDGEIPLEAKILAVADAFEAMTADRPYRTAMSHAAALAELRACAGAQFDPSVVAAFAAVVGATAAEAA
ncbi:MAG TPA: diguanylate cyclase [Baekduia sp.]|nr:diguanylate cyclase [Baekduia sp.]